MDLPHFPKYVGLLFSKRRKKIWRKNKERANKKGGNMRERKEMKEMREMKEMK